MHLLVIYPYIPYPLDRGTYQRTFNLLRELAKSHTIDLIALSENEAGMEHRGVFSEFCREVRFIPFNHPAWPKLSERMFNSTPSTVQHWYAPQVESAIREQLASRHYDLVHVCDIVLVQYFLDEHTDVPLSVDRSRVDLQFQKQRTAVMGGSLKDRVLAWENISKMKRYEKRVAQRTNLQVLCGPDDETYVKQHISAKARTEVIANGVDLDYFDPEKTSTEQATEPTLLFCGAMDYEPNIDALQWYFSTMHQDLRARIPNLKILIIGKSPVPQVQAYARLEGVTVTGSVPDVRPYYQESWAQIVPLRIGGGTRLKIVESLAMGTPVVSTSIGAQGLDLRQGQDALLADSPSAFVDALESVLKQPALRQSLSLQGRQTAQARFSWHGIGAKLSSAYQHLTQQKERIELLQIPFDRVTMKGALSRIDEMVTARSPSFIATANVDFLVQARSDGELRSVLHRADLVVCDGKPLVWLSRLLGKALPERVAGSDLVPRLLETSEQNGWSVYFLGGREDVLEQAVHKTSLKHAGLKIAGAYSPPFAPLAKMNHDDICERIREAKPDILLVSFGCPKQEKWIARHYAKLHVPVSIGVGATIDFLAGSMKRAPKWMQQSGMEWVFRLLQEPRRLLKRYATDLVVFGVAALNEILRNRLPARA